MKARTPFSSLSNNGTNACTTTNTHKRLLVIVETNKGSVRTTGSSIFSRGSTSSKHTPSKPPLVKRSDSRPTPTKFASDDGSFLTDDVAPTTSTLPIAQSSIPLVASGNEDTVATAKCTSSGEEEVELDDEQSLDSLVVSVDAEVDESSSCPTLDDIIEPTDGDVASSTIPGGVAHAGAEVPRMAMVVDSEGRAYRFCPITKQPAWLFDYWQSKEATNLFATFEGEKARQGIKRHIEALERCSEHTWFDFSRDRSATLSEESMYEIVNTKASYVLKALYIANEELQNCASFTKCCEESIRDMCYEDIDSVHDPAVVGRWFADFRKDHKFTLADSSSISTPIWEKSFVQKLFAANEGESAKEALGRHIDSLEHFSAESWKDYCDKGKIKYLKPSAQKVITTKAGYVLAVLQVAKDKLHHCQSFIHCCREVVLNKADVDGLQPIDDPVIIYRWFAEFRDHHTFKVPLYSIAYWESEWARALFDADECEDVRQKIAEYIAKLQKFQDDWQSLVVDGHTIDLTGPEKVELCSKIVYVVNAFANALKHMPRLSWMGCCELAVKRIAQMPGFRKVAEANAVKVYVKEYLDNGGKFHPIIKADEARSNTTWL